MAAAQGALAGKRPSADQATAWLRPADHAELSALLAAASLVRQVTYGDRVELCAIVNARSGRCSENCAFCAQSAHHAAAIESFALLAPDAILVQGRAAAASGIHRFSIVTSGKGFTGEQELDQVCRAVELLRRETELLPCVSLGLLTPVQARRLSSAGAERYHHNIEAGPHFFPEICTTHTFDDRVETIHIARDAGLELCVGGIIGLGETLAQRLDLAVAIADLQPDSVPLNFLNPIAGTPLAAQPRLSVTDALAATAVFKLHLPMAVLRTCGGREQVFGRLAGLMYLAGASATMTGNYLTTEGGCATVDTADVETLGLELGLIPVTR